MYVYSKTILSAKICGLFGDVYTKCVNCELTSLACIQAYTNTLVSFCVIDETNCKQINVKALL